MQSGKTRKRTLANLSHWPATKIETLRRLLRDETLVSPQVLFTTRQTLPHGHVEALLAMIRKLGLDAVIARQRSRERDLVVAMIAAAVSLRRDEQLSGRRKERVGGVRL